LIEPEARGIDNISETYFISDLEADFPEPEDGNRFLVLIVAIDGQEDVGNQSGQHLDHKSVFAP